MRVLVTGGAGFIGSHVVDLLVSDGHEVVSLDAVTAAAHACEPDYLNASAEHRRMRLGDLQGTLAALDGIDAVCHQAARVGLGVDFDDVTDYVQDNALGTATLLKAMYRSDFRGRFVQASSMVVYGEGAYTCPSHGHVSPGARTTRDLESGVFDPPCPVCGARLTPLLVSEHDRLDPRNVYAATKLHQEHLGSAYSSATGVDVVSLRYHNVYGPRMPRDTPYAGVASIVRSACENGIAPSVFEDGAQRRDFVHVADVALANVLALTAPRRIGGCYNIASGEICTIAQMAEAVVSGFDGEVPAPVVTGDYRIGDVRHVTASPELARRTFGFVAQIPFRSGLREFATSPMRASLSTRAASPETPGPRAVTPTPARDTGGSRRTGAA